MQSEFETHRLQTSVQSTAIERVVASNEGNVQTLGATEGANGEEKVGGAIAEVTEGLDVKQREQTRVWEAQLTRRRFRVTSAHWPIIVSIGDILLCIMAASIFFHTPSLRDPLLFLQSGVLFLLIVSMILGVWRVGMRLLRRATRLRQRAVIMGMPQSSQVLLKEIQAARYPLATVLGYIVEIAGRKRMEDAPILGGKSVLRHLVQRGMIDMVITATDYAATPALLQTALESVQLGVTVKPLALLYEEVCKKVPVEHIGEQWYVALPVERVQSLFYLCWRKVLDMIFGLIGLLVLLLLLPVLATLIYLDSPGPIFYQQERVGYRGKKFAIIKFRSMRTDAEQAGQAVWAAQSDVRVTKIGRFMRSTHLDELPQVVNILRGEMSLLGPRPERRAFAEQLEETLPFYRCRLSVVPGLTGWAQVQYPYGSSTNDALEKLQYDLYYIKHQSFLLDMLILLKTVLEVVHCNGR